MEAFYTPDIPGAQAGICTCYAQAHRADPVNTATGMFFEQLTDASLVGPGVPLALERTYRSDSATAGLLGRGWATPFDSKLTVATGKVTYRTDDGASFVFTQNSDGTYKAPAGSAARLVKGTSDYILTTPDHTKRTFTSGGQLVSVLDKAGKGLNLTYASGKLASVKDAAGRTTTFTVGADGLLTKVALPDTTSVSYGYTGGLLTSATDPAGKTSSYTYDANKRLSSYTDPAGGKVSNTYDTAGRITSQTDQNTKTTTFTWDGRRESHTTAPDGGVWTDVYSGNVLMSTIDPYGKSISYDYDRNLRPVGITDQRGNTTSMTYDSAGRMLTRSSPSGLGYKEIWTYDTSGNIASHTDGRISRTTYAYNTSNQLTTTTDPLGGITAYTYTTLGAIQTVKTPRGKVTTYGYDTAGNRTSVTTPLGEKATFTYDAAGRILTKTDPRGNATGADPASHTTTYAYDGRGLLSSATDPLGRTTAYTYNGAEQLLTTKNPEGDTTAFAYDDAGHLTRTTDPAGKFVTRIYSAAGHLASETDAAGNKTTYTYDKVGRLLTSVSPRGNVTGNDPAAHTTSYAYDAAGNSTKVTGPTGAFTTTTYDAINRPLVNTNQLGHTTGYTCDANDNVPTLLTDPSGRTPEDPNDSVDGIGDVLGIFGDAFADVVKSPFVFLGDAHDAFTGENGGAGAFVDKYLPVRPAYRLYRAEYMLRQQGCDALADLYAEAADELTQQLTVTGLGGLTGWRRAAVEPETSGRYGPGAAHADDPALSGANPYVPRGFSGAGYGEFTQELYSGLRAAGCNDSTAIFQGSSVTGQSFKTGEPFRPDSDYDIALAGSDLIEQARKAGVGLRSGGTRTGPLRDVDLRKMRLSGLAEALSEKGGREVHFMIYESVESATGRAPSMIAPRK